MLEDSSATTLLKCWMYTWKWNGILSRVEILMIKCRLYSGSVCRKNEMIVFMEIVSEKQVL